MLFRLKWHIHLSRKFEPVLSGFLPKIITLSDLEVFLSWKRSMLRNVLRSLLSCRSYETQRTIWLAEILHYPYLHIHWTPTCEIWNVLRPHTEMAAEIAKSSDSLCYTQLHAYFVVLYTSSEEFQECRLASAFRFILDNGCVSVPICVVRFVACALLFNLRLKPIESDSY